MKSYIHSFFFLCLLLLPLGVAAQAIVDPDLPGPSTGDKTITVTQATGGTISPGTTTVHSGTDQAFLIKAAEGYVIGSVLVDGQPLTIDADLLSYSHTFTAVSKDHTLTATYIPTRFTLTATAEAGGQVTPTTAVVPVGGNQTFTITANEGYKIKEVKLDGTAVEEKDLVTSPSGITYTITNVQKAGAVTVTFEAIQYTVTIATPSNGSLSLNDKNGNGVASASKVAYGTQLTLEPSPSTGYLLDYLTANQAPLYAKTWTVKADVTLGAQFKKAIYTVTVGVSAKGGTFSVQKENTALLPGTHQLQHGTTLKLENTPATGYTFKHYDLTPGGVTSSTPLTVTGDLAINAVFDPVKYAVTVTAPEAVEGTLSINNTPASSGSTSYAYGTELLLSNTAAAGKTFDKYVVTPAAALNGNRVKVTEATTIGVQFKMVPTGGSPFAVIFTAPLVVKNHSIALNNGAKVDAGTSLTLIIPNTNQQQLVSLTANGNPVDFVTDGGLNTALYTVTAPVTFAQSFRANEFPVRIEPPVGGTLTAAIGGKAVVSGNRYPNGSLVTITATPSEGYQTGRILAGTRDITLSKQITLSEDLILSASFTRQAEINPNPDPSNPDPNAPVGLDLSPQQTYYTGQEQAFRLITQPGGVIDKVNITYTQNGKAVRPVQAGLYDVRLMRAADEHFAALDRSVQGGFEIRKAPVSILSVDVSEDAMTGAITATRATLNGGKAEAQGKSVSGSFAWVSTEAKGKVLTVTTSGYEEVCFTPADAANYQPATTQVYIRVGSAAPEVRKLTVGREGSGTVGIYNGDQLCTASGPFYNGMNLTLKGTPAAGYTLQGFREKGIEYGLQPYRVLMTEDREITAVFAGKAEASQIKVTLTPPVSLVYDGKPKLVAVTSQPVLSGWQVEYRNQAGETVIPVNAGTYRLTVSRAEDETYKAFTQTESFTILQATPVIEETPTAGIISPNAPLSESVLSGGLAKVDGLGVVPGIFEWLDPQSILTASGDHICRFIPTDRTNFASVTQNVNVLVLSYPAPVRITYAQQEGGTLEVTDESDGSPLPSGTLVTAGTSIRVRAVAASYFRFERLQIGTEDCTAEAINNNSTVVRPVYTSKEISATFVRTSYPPVNPDPSPEPDPSPDPDPTPDPDPSPGPDPGIDPTPDPSYPDHTIHVHTTGLGSVYPATSLVKHGSSLTFEVVPGISQQLVDVRLNGNSVGAVSKYVLRNITSDMTLEAVFSQIAIPVYTLTSKVVGKGGSITPTKVRVAEGSNHQFILHVDKGVTLDDVQVGTEKSLKSIGKPRSYIFRAVKADSLMVATFTQPTSIEKMPSSGIRINISGTTVSIDLPDPSSEVSIYTVGGQLRFRKKLPAGLSSFSLPEGIYVIEVNGQKSRWRQKIGIL